MCPNSNPKTGMPKELGELCPRCRYSLHGLPDRHHCPECGFAYDVHAKVFAASRWIWVGLMIANGVMAIVLLVLFVFLRNTLGLALLPAFLLMIGGATWRLRRAGNLVLVSGKQLQVLTRKGLDSYSLNEVAKMAWDPVTGDILVLSTSGTCITRIPSSFLSSNRRAQSLVAYVMLELERKKR